MKIFALALSLVAAPAFADSAVTVVDDEPTSSRAAGAAASRGDKRLPADTGELRSATVPAARIDATAASTTSAAAASEHAVAPPHVVASRATDDDIATELAARQMRRHVRALDGCVSAAQRRSPSIAGTVTLAFDVAERKVARVRITDDSAHDFELAACLTRVSQRLTFSLAAAHFSWAVTVAPSASPHQ